MTGTRMLLGIVSVAVLATPALAAQSSPAPSCVDGKRDACWVEVDNHPGCQFWHDDLTPSVKADWSGECSNGLAQGQGTITWDACIPDNRSCMPVTIQETGSFLDGRRQGRWIDGPSDAAGCHRWNTEMYFKAATLEDVTSCLQDGADVNVHDRQYQRHTPLHLAVRWNELPMVEILMKAGADLEARQGGGGTPLHEAAWSSDDPAVFQALLQAGADVNALGRDPGPTPRKATGGRDAPRRPGEVFRDCDGCLEMVVLPGGGLALGRYEVTVGEYRAFAVATGGGAGGACVPLNDGETWRNPGFPQTDRHPVACVSWDEAQAYVTWLSRTAGAGYRLPTEAEWDRAAAGFQRGCDRWRTGNPGNPGTCPVGSHGSNAAGLSDMVGNVWEWMEDCLERDCRAQRVVRGGSWDDFPVFQRPGMRWSHSTVTRSISGGFRVVGSVCVKACTDGNGTSWPSRRTTWSAHRNLTTAQHDFARRMACPVGAPRGLMCIPRPAHGHSILFQHGFEHLQARRDDQLLELGLRIDQDVDQRKVPGRRRLRLAPMDDCARLLHGGSFLGASAPGFSHRPYITTSREPPLQISTASRTSPFGLSLQALDPEGRHLCSVRDTAYRGEEHSIWLRLSDGGYQVVDLDHPCRLPRIPPARRSSASDLPTDRNALLHGGARRVSRTRAGRYT